MILRTRYLESDARKTSVSRRRVGNDSTALGEPHPMAIRSDHPRYYIPLLLGGKNEELPYTSGAQPLDMLLPSPIPLSIVRRDSRMLAEERNHSRIVDRVAKS